MSFFASIGYSETDATAAALGAEFVGQGVSGRDGRESRGRERIQGRAFFGAKIGGTARRTCNRSVGCFTLNRWMLKKRMGALTGAQNWEPLSNAGAAVPS
jgi:hypothetical protein